MGIGMPSLFCCTDDWHMRRVRPPCKDAHPLPLRQPCGTLVPVKNGWIFIQWKFSLLPLHSMHSEHIKEGWFAY
jgi:hypothetical protein